jgi:hypothetical protein
MATIEELRQSLPYPQTYTPQVAAGAAVTMARQPGAAHELVLHPYLLCQDWDKRVFFHWKDSHQAHTLEITRIVEDTPERFVFRASEDEPVTYTLTSLTIEAFDRYFREEYERRGSVPDFPTQAALHAWLLRR